MPAVLEIRRVPRLLTSILVIVYVRFPRVLLNSDEVKIVQTIAQWLVPLRL
jgi:hypothetical protein